MVLIEHIQGIPGKTIEAMDIQVKQKDRFCTVREIIQYRPSTFEELLQRQKDFKAGLNTQTYTLRAP